MKSSRKQQGSRKLSQRFFSFVLSLLLLFTAVPPVVLPSYATGKEEAEEVVSEEAGSYTYTEIEELREESVKHFRRSDGKQTAILYAEPVHVEENGVFVDLDNRLVPGADGRYATVNERFQVFWGETAAAVPAARGSSVLMLSDREMSAAEKTPAPVEVRYEGYSLSWSVSAVKRPTLTVTGGQRLPALSAGLTELQIESASGASKAELAAMPAAAGKVSYTAEEIGSSFSSVSGLTYRDAFGSEGKVDLAYTVASNRLEEDIIVKGRGDIDRYVLTMTAPALTAVEDRSISFQNDAGETIFTIGAPWMCDSADAFSEAIGVTLDQQGESVTVVYTPDREWLNDSERVYPVRIDPSVRTKGYKTYIEDPM